MYGSTSNTGLLTLSSTGSLRFNPIVTLSSGKVNLKRKQELLQWELWTNLNGGTCIAGSSTTH